MEIMYLKTNTTNFQVLQQTRYNILGAGCNLCLTKDKEEFP